MSEEGHFTFLYRPSWFDNRLSQDEKFEQYGRIILSQSANVADRLKIAGMLLEAIYQQGAPKMVMTVTTQAKVAQKTFGGSLAMDSIQPSRSDFMLAAWPQVAALYQVKKKDLLKFWAKEYGSKHVEEIR